MMTTFGASSGNTRFSMLNVARPLATRAEFAADIRRNWLNALEATVQVGRRLIEAKETLPHGDYEAMIREDLPFKPATARKLREVAEFVDQGKVPLEQLPDAYSTVYAIATMPEEQLQAAVDQGVIRPDVTRAEVEAFRRPVPPPSLPAPPTAVEPPRTPRPGLEALFAGADQLDPPAPRPATIDPAPPARPASLAEPPVREFRPEDRGPGVPPIYVHPSAPSDDIDQDGEEDPPGPVFADAMERPWLADPDDPGVVLVDLGPAGRPTLMVVDPDRSTIEDDTVAAAIAEYIVDLHNARLMAGRAHPVEDA